jgi:pimeloyl-ACP methyl ester carboxylesterase
MAGALVMAALLTAGCTQRSGAVMHPTASLHEPQRELVVLVHGLGRSRLSMLPLQWALERQGYDVLNWGYSSTSGSVPEIGAALSVALDSVSRPIPGRPTHLVGHSLGNIIIRWALLHHPPPNVRRVVMLAPPNQGARSADRYARYLGWLLRPLPGLVTTETGTARALGTPVGVEIGIIAGDKDGKVTVAETHLVGETEHIVVAGWHTLLMAQPQVQRLTATFLRTGTFSSE